MEVAKEGIFRERVAILLFPFLFHHVPEQFVFQICVNSIQNRKLTQMMLIVNPAHRDPDSCPSLRLVRGYYLQSLVVLSTQDVLGGQGRSYSSGTQEP